MTGREKAQKTQKNIRLPHFCPPAFLRFFAAKPVGPAAG